MVAHPASRPLARAVAARSQPPAGRAPALALVVLVLSSTSLVAQPSFFEPKEGFYGARGTLVKAKWDVDRTSVPEDGILLATLTVTGVINPEAVRRPDLAKVPEFNDRFVVEDAPGPPPAAGKAVAFAYHLRPRNRDVKDVPGFNFFYFNPSEKVRNPFMNARAKGVTIAVTPAAPKAIPPAVPLEGPERLFAVEGGARVLDDEPFAPGAAAWAVLAVLAVLLPAGWYAAWRAAYPDAARLARRRRSRAARRALAGVRAAGRSADPAAECAAAVLGYLRARHPLPPGTDTPPEAAAALAALGVAAADDVADFLRACDAARFAPHADTAASLAAAAESLVARLEAAE